MYEKKRNLDLNGILWHGFVYKEKFEEINQLHTLDYWRLHSALIRNINQKREREREIETANMQQIKSCSA